MNWVKTDIVIQVKYKERTDQGLLRQPAFLRVREDKAPTECILPGSEAEDDPAETQHPVAEPARLQLTNLDKVFWPEDGLAKGDLIQYYSDISPWLLPYLRDRPVVLTRYPDGIEGKSFQYSDRAETDEKNGGPDVGCAHGVRRSTGGLEAPAGASAGRVGCSRTAASLRYAALAAHRILSNPVVQPGFRPTLITCTRTN